MASFVAVGPRTVSMTWLGEASDLTATVYDQFGQPMQAAQIVWESSAIDVVAVDNRGKVTGLALGAAYVVARSDALRDSAQVNVSQVAVSLTVTGDRPITVDVSSGRALAVEARDKGGSPAPQVAVDWLSRDSAVATVTGTVSQGFTLTGVGPGTTWILARAGSAEDSVVVKVLPPADDKPIAFAYRAGIYRTGTVEGTPLRLFAGQEGVSLPDWSPTGDRIAFSDGDIWVVSADGSDAIRVADGSVDEQYPVWSPTGEWIAFQTWEGPSPRIVRPSGEDEHLIAGDSVYGTLHHWSPDGRYIAFKRKGAESGIYTVGVDGSGLTLLYGLYGAGGPRWSPGGELIAFAVDPLSGDADIFVMAPDGSGLQNLTDTDEWDEEQPRWSPDGQYLAFLAQGVSGGKQVHVMRRDGTARVSWTEGHGHDHYDLAWSPTGDAIVVSAGPGYPAAMVLLRPSTEEYVAQGRWPAWRR